MASKRCSAVIGERAAKPRVALGHSRRLPPVPRRVFDQCESDASMLAPVFVGPGRVEWVGFCETHGGKPGKKK